MICPISLVIAVRRLAMTATEMGSTEGAVTDKSFLAPMTVISNAAKLVADLDPRKHVISNCDRLILSSTDLGWCNSPIVQMFTPLQLGHFLCFLSSSPCLLVSLSPIPLSPLPFNFVVDIPLQQSIEG